MNPFALRTFFVLIFTIFLTSSGDEISFGFTDEESVTVQKNGLELVPQKHVEREFEAWLGRTGKSFPGMGEEIPSPQMFEIGLAQSLAQAFCQSEREQNGRSSGAGSTKAEESIRRCLWSEYQTCVSYVLKPFDKTFAHHHLEGASTEARVRAQLPSVTPCATFEGVPSAIQFANLVAASAPVVFKGAIKRWSAVERWTFDYLAKALPSMTWPVSVSPHGNFDCVERTRLWQRDEPPSQHETKFNLEVDVNQILGSPASEHKVPLAESGDDRHGGKGKDIAVSKLGFVGSTQEEGTQENNYLLARPASVELTTSQMLQAFAVTGTRNMSHTTKGLHTAAAPQSSRQTPTSSSFTAAAASSTHAMGPKVSQQQEKGGRGPKAYIEYFPLARLRYDAMHRSHGEGKGEEALRKVDTLLGEGLGGWCSAFAKALSLCPEKHEQQQPQQQKQQSGEFPGHQEASSRVRCSCEKGGIQLESSKLAAEKDVLAFADFLIPTHRLLWLGSGGTIGNLHFDRQENLMAVLRGAKTFTLYDPTQSKNLYHGVVSIQEVHLQAEVSTEPSSDLSNSSTAFVEEVPSSFTLTNKLKTPVRSLESDGALVNGSRGGGSSASDGSSVRNTSQSSQEGDVVIRIGRPRDALARALSPELFAGGRGGGDSAIKTPSGDPVHGPQRGKKEVQKRRSGGEQVNEEDNISVYSPVNASDPNVLEEFPEFAKAKSWTCRAEAGDLLFVPSRWWHEVESEGDAEGKTAAVNLWYKPWYYKLAFREFGDAVIRNEHYAHLQGERRSAVPCPDNPSEVCWVVGASSPESSTPPQQMSQKGAEEQGGETDRDNGSGWL